jgi:hypothetical protein
MLEKLWDDVVAGPHPETGLEKLRKAATSRPIVIDDKGSAARSFTVLLLCMVEQFGTKLRYMRYTKLII